jgi:hypothetical protein
MSSVSSGAGELSGATETDSVDAATGAVVPDEEETSTAAGGDTVGSSASAGIDFALSGDDPIATSGEVGGELACRTSNVALLGALDPEDCDAVGLRAVARGSRDFFRVSSISASEATTVVAVVASDLLRLRPGPSALFFRFFPAVAEADAVGARR